MIFFAYHREVNPSPVAVVPFVPLQAPAGACRVFLGLGGGWTERGGHESNSEPYDADAAFYRQMYTGTVLGGEGASPDDVSSHVVGNQCANGTASDVMCSFMQPPPRLSCGCQT